MHSKAVSGPVYVELLNREIVGDADVSSALLTAMRLWVKETQEARDAEEEQASRLRQLMN